MIHIETERLLLRDWQKGDQEPFTKINQDVKVMEFMPKLLSATESLDMIKRMQEHQQNHGYSLFACELKETGELIGFVGLFIPPFEAHFTTHSTEIGWRLSSNHWGNGYATEAARAVLAHGFTIHNLPEIVSFTTRNNVRSRRVMEKIGLVYDETGDFQHPRLPANHPLSWHVLYRMTKKKYNDTSK